MDSGESIDNENDGRDEEEEDHDFSSPAVPVVVYGAEQRRAKIVQSSDRRFMSSKISKIRSNQSAASAGMTKKEKEDEMESMANDRSLYKLIHTRLLTTSLDDPLALDLKGSKKKKSLEGRVLEVANAAKLGKGETTVRKQEHAKVPRKIREGMEKRRKELKQMKLQEAKDVGNYHPTIKKLLADDSDRPKRNAKRERGLRMGVGTFKGGTLTLGKQDIQKARGHGLAHRHSKNRKRGLHAWLDLYRTFIHPFARWGSVEANGQTLILWIEGFIHSMMKAPYGRVPSFSVAKELEDQLRDYVHDGTFAFLQSKWAWDDAPLRDIVFHELKSPGSKVETISSGVNALYSGKELTVLMNASGTGKTRLAVQGLATRLQLRWLLLQVLSRKILSRDIFLLQYNHLLKQPDNVVDELLASAWKTIRERIGPNQDFYLVVDEAQNIELLLPNVFKWEDGTWYEPHGLLEGVRAWFPEELRGQWKTILIGTELYFAPLPLDAHTLHGVGEFTDREQHAQYVAKRLWPNMPYNSAVLAHGEVLHRLFSWLRGRCVFIEVIYIAQLKLR
ncbi:hypothetical protein FRC17_010703 [Serendipita sp. 399]|nr:hypothetical protein FRC17_010703 [Serendipita sp. 399]